MKVCMLYLFVLGSFINGSWANEDLPKPIEEWMHLNLTIEKECRDPLCMNVVVLLGSQKIVLDPVKIEYDNNGKAYSNHYRGYWSDVKDIDGVRFIAILTLNKMRIMSSDPEMWSYSVVGEILGEEGPVGKIHTTTTDLTRLNYVELIGNAQVYKGLKYVPNFRIGPSTAFPPSICKPDSPHCKKPKLDLDSASMRTESADWILSLGDIR